MAKYEYTVKYNGRKYLPGEEVPLKSINTETVAVTEEVAVAESETEELKEAKSTPVKKNKGGKKPKA